MVTWLVLSLGHFFVMSHVFSFEYHHCKMPRAFRQLFLYNSNWTTPVNNTCHIRHGLWHFRMNDCGTHVKIGYQPWLKCCRTHSKTRVNTGCTLLSPYVAVVIFIKDTQFSAHKHDIWDVVNYRQTSNISRVLMGNNIFDHSDILGASPVGAASTTSSLSTLHMA